jgi:dolichol-phosphate mannosyltransferase
MPNSRRPKFTTVVAVPVFNEIEYVDDVLKAVRKFSTDILVVDDGSTDGTSEVLKRHSYARTISHTTNLGYGKSLMDAFAFALHHRFDWLITIDCDYQHEPSCIPEFCREIEKNDADIISGSRYLDPVDPNSTVPAERIAINKEITRMLNESLGLKLTDSFCGFKAYRTASIAELKLTETGYRFPLQLWIRAARAGLKLREIPVPLIYHDPERNFAGVLEDPQYRLNYYMEIIEKELTYDVGQNITRPDHTKARKPRICTS